MTFGEVYGFALGIGVGFGAAAIWVVSSIVHDEESAGCSLHPHMDQCAHRGNLPKGKR